MAALLYNSLWASSSSASIQRQDPWNCHIATGLSGGSHHSGNSPCSLSSCSIQELPTAWWESSPLCTQSSLTCTAQTLPPLAQQVNVHPLLQMYSAHHKVCNFPLHRATSSLLLPSACSTSSSSEPRGESATPCSLRRRTAVLNKLFSSGVPSHQQGLRLSYEMKIEKKAPETINATLSWQKPIESMTWPLKMVVSKYIFLPEAT